MKIRIVFSDPYPVGMGFQRIQMYARGLMTLGHNVGLVIPKPLERRPQVRNPDPRGTCEGVPFAYSWHTTLRSDSFIGRRVHDVFAPLRAAIMVLRDRPDVILLWANSVYLIVLFRCVASLCRATYVQEKSELPFFRCESLGFWQQMYIRCVYRFFDGILVISDVLANYLRPHMRRKARLLLVPILVNVDSVYDPGIERRKALVFAGTLTQHKDGVLTIIEAFTRLAPDFPDFELIMTGDLSVSPVRDQIVALMTNPAVKGRIHLPGLVDRAAWRTTVNQAAVLLLAKPRNRQNTACMPTKLGEYLATGNPVLTTAVGGVSAFLAHRVNAFLAEPTVDDFTDCLRDILMHPELAREVGKRGQDVARQEFNHAFQTRRMADFFAALRMKGRG